MKRYVELQIIKHALQYYLNRDASEDEKAKERTVLQRTEEEIERVKDRCGIR